MSLKETCIAKAKERAPKGWTLNNATYIQTKEALENWTLNKAVFIAFGWRDVYE